MMTWLDIVMLAIILVWAIGCIAKGFFVSIFGVAGIALGLVWAEQYHSELATYIAFFGAPNAESVISYIFILLATMFFAALLGVSFRNGAARIKLNVVDRSLGLLFGLAMGVVSCDFLWQSLLASSFQVSEVVQDSRIGSLLLQLFH